MAAYGAGWCFTVPVVGNLYAAELIAALCLPFLGLSKTINRYVSLRLVLTGYGLILCGLILSDVVNDTPLHDLARGWANPIVAAISLTFVVSVLRRDAYAFLYFLFATFLFKLIFGDAGYTIRYGYVDLSVNALLAHSDLFKIRIIPFLMPAAMLVAFYVYRFGVVWSGLLYAGTAVTLIVLGARSASLAFLAAAGILFLTQSRFRLSGKGLALIAIPALIGGQLLYISYVDYTLAENPTGHTAIQLKSLQNSYNPLELLLRGRSDWSIADVIIRDNPIFGHGSWARDADRKYFNKLVEQSGDSFDVYSIGNDVPLMPTHSFLLTSWIWGGVIAFMGSLFVLWGVIKSIKPALLYRGAFSAIAAVVTALLLWDLFFSPIQVMRLTFPHFIGVLLVLADTSRYGKYKRMLAQRRLRVDAERPQ